MVKKTYKVEFKSKPMGCISSPPRFGVLNILDGEGRQIGRRVYGTKQSICPQCGKPWLEHRGYVERPIEYGEE
jgi:hypothetical protein